MQDCISPVKLLLRYVMPNSQSLAFPFVLHTYETDGKHIVSDKILGITTWR